MIYRTMASHLGELLTNSSITINRSNLTRRVGAYYHSNLVTVTLHFTFTLVPFQTYSLH